MGLIIGGAGLLWFSHHRACNCGCGRKFCTCLNQVKIEEKPKNPRSNYAITGLYFFDNKVIQYSKTGVPIREYTFNGIFPVNITEMEVDWNATDIIQEFQVTFQYDWWEISGGSTGNAGGN